MLRFLGERVRRTCAQSRNGKPGSHQMLREGSQHGIALSATHHSPRCGLPDKGPQKTRDSFEYWDEESYWLRMRVYELALVLRAEKDEIMLEEEVNVEFSY